MRIAPNIVKRIVTGRVPAFANWPGRLEPRTIYVPHPSGAAVLRDGWKLIWLKEENERQLFNVRADPSEERELSATEPDRLREMQTLLDELRQADVTELPADLAGQAP